MHELIFSVISFQHYAIFVRKSEFKKINSKTGFQNRKPVFGVRTHDPPVESHHLNQGTTMSVFD